MANQITDNRTLINTFSTVSGVVDFNGAIAGVQDTEVFIGNSASITEYTSNTLSGIMADAGTPQDWSNNTFYIINNCGIVGQLQSKIAGGWRIRFAGALVSDYFEVYIGGSDSWPPATEGGWVQWVVDIENARATAIANGWVGGTPPPTTAIRYVGSGGITSTMPRMADNTWYGEIRRLPAGSAGIIVEGRNGGVTDWNLEDIVTELPAGTLTATYGEAGSIVLNTRVQIGINDSTTHGFSSTNTTVLFSDQEFVSSDLYGLTGVGGSGTSSIVFGVKSGVGIDATGAQGGSIESNSAGVRWDLNFSDPLLNTVGLYGVTYKHGAILDVSNPNVECISATYIDITDILVDQSFQSRINLVSSGQFDQNGATLHNVSSSGGIGIHALSIDDLSKVSLISTDGTLDLSNVTTTDITLTNFTCAGGIVSDPLPVVITQGLGSNIGVTADWSNTGGGSVSVVIPVKSLEISGIIVGSEFRIYDGVPLGGNDLGTEVAGIEVTTNTTFSYSHSGADTTVVLQMIDTNYEEVIQSVTLGNVDQQVTLFPKLDPNK